MSKGNTMQVLKVLATIDDEITRVNEIVDLRTNVHTKNSMPLSHHASRCNKNVGQL